MLQQRVLSNQQIQRAIYALQTKAVRLGRDVRMGLAPEELPPLPASPVTAPH